ncbi:YciI family protein [Rhizobium sp.]|uniref:YciI family protein n=1 Tax=Rhizobium sp. TaxID=391 RepID=UPI002F06FA39
MLYVVTLNYVRPPEAIQTHLDSHREWLIEHTKSGHIIVAGPMDPPTGGIVLASCEDRSELDKMLHTDSFYVNELVEYDIRAFNPALRGNIFAAQWAPQAKAVPTMDAIG